VGLDRNQARALVAAADADTGTQVLRTAAAVRLLRHVGGARRRGNDRYPDTYERQRDVRRQIAHHVGKLDALGFEVTLCRIPEPQPDGTGQTQAA
jgi:hypothetical protein